MICSHDCSGRRSVGRETNTCSANTRSQAKPPLQTSNDNNKSTQCTAIHKQPSPNDLPMFPPFPAVLPSSLSPPPVPNSPPIPFSSPIYLSHPSLSASSHKHLQPKQSAGRQGVCKLQYITVHNCTQMDLCATKNRTKKQNETKEM